MKLVKCLSVKQPHAGRIASGEKTLEIRYRRTHYRGSLIICSSKRPYIDESQPVGVTLCVVDLVDCIEFDIKHEQQACIDYIPGQFAWVLENVRTIDHMPVKGQISMFLPSSHVVRRIQSLL